MFRFDDLHFSPDSIYTYTLSDRFPELQQNQRKSTAEQFSGALDIVARLEYEVESLHRALEATLERQQALNAQAVRHA